VVSSKDAKGLSADAERPNTDIFTSTQRRGVAPAGLWRKTAGSHFPADEMHLQHLNLTEQRKYIAATNILATQAVVGQLDVVVNVRRRLIPSDVVDVGGHRMRFKPDLFLMLFARVQVNHLHRNKRERVEAGQEPEYLMPLKTEWVSEIGNDSLPDCSLVLLRHCISAFPYHESPLVTTGIAPYADR
jgi:hypothetical protein